MAAGPAAVICEIARSVASPLPGEPEDVAQIALPNSHTRGVRRSIAASRVQARLKDRSVKEPR